ncbi:MAG: SpaA isopeptide-forming pilin-related protein [Porcipelethomonas sp.]
MKKIRSFLSAAITAIMVLCLCSFNVSAETYTITIDDPTGTSGGLIDGRTFTAYKVFALTYSGTNYTYTLDANCLNGTTGYGPTYDLATVTAWPSDDETNARNFATYLYETYIDGQTVAASVHQGSAIASSGTATITVPEAGYYMVVENSDVSGLTSLVMLNSTDPTVTIDAKIGSTGKPTLNKLINDQNANFTNTYLDSQIGDTVFYCLDITVPDPDYINEFTNYVYKIHDSIDSGLTLNENILMIWKNESTYIEKNAGNSSDYFTSSVTGGTQLEVDIKIKKLIEDWSLSAGDTLKVYYHATLNKDANVAASADDDNMYNANEAYLEFSNDPYGATTINTPAIKTYDWTYAFSVEKVDGSDNTKKLAGAKFEIQRNSAALSLLKSGNGYTVVPNGTEGAVTEAETDENGKFIIRGIDQGVTYTIHETKAPDGYGLPDSDATITLNATYTNGGSEIDTLKGTITNARDATGLNVVIENSSGSKLVGTGGIGTTVFYVFGGILMAGAAVLLTVKIRIKNK